MNAFAGIGLMFDVVGVAMLWLALMATSNRTLFVQSGMYWGGNSAVYRALVVQRCDMQFGLPTLVVGFFIADGSVGFS